MPDLIVYSPPPQKWNPHQGQIKGVKFLLDHAAAGLFAEPGTGKTSMTLAAFKVLKTKNQARKMLLIAPLKPCYLVWPLEIKKWIDFNHLTYRILHGSKKDQYVFEDTDIHIINPEGLEWLLDARRTDRGDIKLDMKGFKALGYDTLVIDEISKFKHTNSWRFKILKRVLATFQRRWGLTGSPAANGLHDLFGQCYILDQGRALGEYVSHYRMNYFLQGPDGFTWHLKSGAADQIYEKIKPLVLRLSASDYVDMPDLINIDLKFELPKKVKDIYDKLEKVFIAKIKDRTIEAANAGVATMKCRQIANGGVYADPEISTLLKDGFTPRGAGREVIDLHSEKIELLSDLIDELQGSPLLVAYDFNHDLARIRGKLGKDLPYLGAGISPKRATEIEALWNRGEIPVLLGHPASMGHGLNLQGAGQHVCWFGIPWDYDLYDQLIRRVWRQGNQHKRVFVHHIIAKNTIDEVIMSVLRQKARGQQALFDALKEIANVE